MTLDRIDVNRNYEPGNVRWATIGQQRWNRRDMIYRQPEEPEEREERATIDPPPRPTIDLPF